MNRKSAALLTTIARCNPQDKELNRESLIQQIIHLDETHELSVRTTLAPIYNEYFTEDKLRELTDKQLYATLKAIPLIPSAIENVIYSLKNGAGPMLGADDKPDFMDAESLKRLIAKTDQGGARCYTNINSDNYMAIFAGSTVKTIGDAFTKLPTDCSDYGAEIDKLMGGKLYCISSSEIEEREKEYQGKLDELNTSIERSKTRRRRYRFIKAEIGAIALLVPTIAAGATGAISPSILAGCTMTEVVLAIAYWILG